MERTTVDLVSERSRTVRLSKPGVADKPRYNGGAYSVTTKKTRAGTEGGGRAGTEGGGRPVAAIAPPGCEVLDICDGHVMLRIHGSVVKITEADARVLAEMLAKALP